MGRLLESVVCSLVGMIDIFANFYTFIFDFDGQFSFAVNVCNQLGFEELYSYKSPHGLFSTGMNFRRIGVLR